MTTASRRGPTAKRTIDRGLYSQRDWNHSKPLLMEDPRAMREPWRGTWFAIRIGPKDLDGDDVAIINLKVTDCLGKHSVGSKD